MQKLILFLVITALSVPAFAVQNVNVDQLQQMLISRKTAGESDGDMAQHIAQLQLTERLSTFTLDKMKQSLSPGPKTLMALNILADASALLDPPASELPAKPAPDIPTQQAIMNAAVHYVATTFSHLPNFLATRLTHSFDNSPLVVTHSGWAPSDSALHLAGTFNQEITYRDGREVSIHSVTTSGVDTKQGASPPGLTSTGEFGPILATILRDASKGKIAWSHWEQMPAGVAAVFSYQVPKAASHYEVDFCCVRGSEDSSSYSGGNSSQGTTPNSYRGMPAYHGSLYIDPATGTILRVTLDAELDSNKPIKRSSVAVMYTSVDIAGKTYTCPASSVAISLASTRLGGDMSDRSILRINEVTFTDYHRFGTKSRIITDASGQ